MGTGLGGGGVDSITSVDQKCLVITCDKTATARGWCPKHWWRWRHYGTPDIVTVYDLTPEERFWQKVNKTDSCWLWTAGVRGDGYGAFRFQGKQISAHRYSYILHRGEIPTGMVVMHSCDTPICVNPEHLSVGTNRDNTADSLRKGRHKGLPGSRNLQAKLTEAQVIALREQYARGGVTQKELAAQYEISHALVSFIVTRKAWRHI